MIEDVVVLGVGTPAVLCVHYAGVAATGDNEGPKKCSVRANPVTSDGGGSFSLTSMSLTEPGYHNSSSESDIPHTTIRAT